MFDNLHQMVLVIHRSVILSFRRYAYVLRENLIRIKYYGGVGISLGRINPQNLGMVNIDGAVLHTERNDSGVSFTNTTPGIVIERQRITGLHHLQHIRAFLESREITGESFMRPEIEDNLIDILRIPVNRLVTHRFDEHILDYRTAIGNVIGFLTLGRENQLLDTRTVKSNIYRLLGFSLFKYTIGGDSL